tara:strand:- start:38514 stop:39695 length:1182 start_codon:yes stop_codon:yes gene_type:complete
MKMLQIFRDFIGTSETRSIKSSDPWLYAMFGGQRTNGHMVNPTTAEQLSTVLACVQTTANGISALPNYVFRKSANGREIAHDHALSRMILEGPNDKQTWPDYMEWLVASILLRGNGLSEIVSDRRGKLLELRPIPWDHVAVNQSPTGQLTYDIPNRFFVDGRSTGTRRLLQSEVLHIRDRSDDGLIGRSRISRASGVIGGALTLQSFTHDLYGKNLNPSGILSSSHKLKPEAAETIRQKWQGKFGIEGDGGIAVLDGDWSFQKMSINPEDAELLAARRFTTEELARIFQVPPPLVGIWDHSSFTNSETAGRWFAQHTLQPLIRKIEAAFHKSLFTATERESMCVEIDLSGFMRGDYAARWSAHKIAVDAGILTVDEVREIEGWGPLTSTEGAG